MACTSPFPPHVTVTKLVRTQVVVPSSFFSICRRLWKIPGITISISSSSGGGGVFPCRVRSSHSSELAFSQGPSCIFVGPLETASKELLEALYRQARDAYYSGEPLIVDDMFDKVELKLRLYGSKSVVKYPRCSLRRQSTYSDAESEHYKAFGGMIWLHSKAHAQIVGRRSLPLCRQNNQINLLIGQIAMYVSALWNFALSWSNSFQDQEDAALMVAFT